MRTYDVVVLGAGIVGAACARECALAGLRVAIVEPGVPGGAASAAGMGHVVAMDDSPAQLALSLAGRELWRELRPQLPRAVEYEERGTLWVAADDEEMAEVHSKQRTYARSGVRTEVLDGRTVADAEPSLRPGLCGGLLVPGDAVVYPPAAARFFLDEAILCGAVLLRGQPAVSAGNGTVQLRDGSVLSAAAIVVATGTDTSLVPSVEILPRKGHLVITDRYPGYVRHQIVEVGYLKSAHGTTGAHGAAADSVAFNVQPRQTGQLLLGSSRQYGATSAAVDAAILKRMIDRAVEYLPGLYSLAAIRCWTGFRASTPDKLPLIGPTADPTVHLLMGFEGLGITNAPSAGRLAADGIVGRRPFIDGTPYLPARLVREAVVHA